ncbi:MAG: MBL fold metallo-hydrolase [Ornithinimicrobium sp.]
MQSPGSSPDPPWVGGGMSERAWCQLCPNPSPMTLDGTNTWILTEPGSTASIVIDPGPLDEDHLSSVLTHVQSIGSRVALTLLTHRHDDHAQSAGRFRDLTGAPVRAIGRGHDDLGEGDRVTVAGLEVWVVSTPGHTDDSVSFVLPAEQTLLTGDTILGRGSTVVAHPDGRLSAYLESLERLRQLTASGQVTRLAPGHGPAVFDAEATVTGYIEHRARRLDQVREAVDRHRDTMANGEHTDDLADAVVRTVYADVSRDLWPAARLSVLAQLEYLGQVSGRDE